MQARPKIPAGNVSTPRRANGPTPPPAARQNRSLRKRIRAGICGAGEITSFGAPIFRLQVTTIVSFANSRQSHFRLSSAQPCQVGFARLILMTGTTPFLSSSSVMQSRMIFIAHLLPSEITPEIPPPEILHDHHRQLPPDRPLLVSCIRSSSYYSEAFHQDRKTVSFLDRSGTKAQVST